MRMILFVNAARLAAALIFVDVTLVKAQEPKALQGLRITGLYVPSVDDDGTRAAPDSTRIGDLIELKLRREGLQVSRPFADSAGTYIKYEVQCAYHRTLQVFACDLSLALKDIVTVKRNANSVYADLWSRGTLFLLAKGSLREAIEDKTNELADAFVLDWLRANPKK
jgi:hypothetical protein